MLYPPGLEYIEAFLACLYAGCVAVPAYPPRLKRGMARLTAIAMDAQPSAALTTAKVLAGIGALGAPSAALGHLQWIATDSLQDGPQIELIGRDADSRAVVMLQYTSGSTASPKGVMITNANLVHNHQLMRRAFGHDDRALIVGWLPLYHDMGLIGNVLHTLYLGASAVLMSPSAFLQRPFRWLETISTYRGTTSGGPDFAFELCLRRITPAERDRLDLRTWRTAFNGAERVRPRTLERFARYFAPCGFDPKALYPCYGLAEATLIVSGAPERRRPLTDSDHDGAAKNNVSEDTAARQVSCGVALHDDSVAIVDPQSLRRCAAGEVGEIWIDSPSVACGYWNRPEETANTFAARPSGDSATRSFLRTGDLGCLVDGELFIRGRLKDLIIIRGVNHYPDDIESTAQSSHSALRASSGAAFAVEKDETEQVAIVQELEPGREADAAEAIDAIRRSVGRDLALELSTVVLVRPGSIPKTSSGKVRRSVCRQMLVEGALPVLAKWDRSEHSASCPGPAAETAATADTIEAWLVERLATSVGNSNWLHSDLTLAQCGLDSLATVELGHAIELAFGVQVPVEVLLGPAATIRDLAAYTAGRTPLQSLAGDPSRVDPGRVDPSEIELSYGQEAVWVASQLDPLNGAYNLAAAVRLVTQVDVASIRQSFAVLVRRHPLLRVTFEREGIHVVQRVHGTTGEWFTELDGSGWDTDTMRAALAAEADRPFDLENGPLFRVVVISGLGGEVRLLLAIHHMVADFWSLAILLRDFGRVYDQIEQGRPMDAAAPAENYAGYIEWQRAFVHSPAGLSQLAYWRKQLDGAPTALSLPADHARPSVQTFRGASESVWISGDLAASLRQVAADNGTSLYTVLLTAFQVFLLRAGGHEDIIVGSPAAARTGLQWKDVVGYFANPLPLRSQLAGNPTFEEAIGRARETVAGALANQDYPLARLQDAILEGRRNGAAGLFRIMFLFYGSGLSDVALGGLAVNVDGARAEVGRIALESTAIPREVAQYDLVCAMAPIDDRIAVSIKYSTDLFQSDTVRRFASQFVTLLESAAAAPQARVMALAMMTRAERRRLLTEWNQTPAAYRPQCIHELFEVHAERTPDALAVAAGGERCSYKEIDGRANQVARRLGRLGVGPETRVGLCVKRSVDLIAGMLGILKAGAAYVPLDPDGPRERLRWMLYDANVAVLVTQAGLLDDLSGFSNLILRLDLDLIDLRQEPVARLRSGVTPANLAYVIYTSGSTGRPKGVAVEHRQLVNYVHGISTRLDLAAGSTFATVSTVAADLGNTMIFPALSSGGSLHVISEDTSTDAAALAKYVTENQIDYLKIVPSHLAALLAAGVDARMLPRRMLVLGGEASSAAWVGQLQEASPECAIVNHYGPTETTVGVLTYRVAEAVDQAEWKTIPLGRPLPNAQVYVLDRHGQPVPVGIIGELFIGGTGVTRGYLGRGGATAEKYVPNPFGMPGTRLYRTGDLARYRADGNVDFVGRADHQVKVNGFRIELGEIEAAVGAHPAVQQAVVVVRQERSGEKRLVAYIVGRDEGRWEASELRRFLKTTLPAYMVPSAFVPLERMPLTRNGKVDYNGLPAADVAAVESLSAFVAPRTVLEQALARIWAESLNLEAVGIHDDFFELGGHSLLAAGICARLQTLLRTDKPIAATFFQNTTIAGLANAIEQSGLADQPATALLER